MRFDIFKGDTLSFIILYGLLIIFILIALSRGQFFDGLRETKDLTQSIFTRIAAAFLLAGFAQVLIPSDLIAKWMGEDSGWGGIIFAWLAGALAPGGPFLSFPFLAILYQKGASVAIIITFLSSWSLIGFFRIITWELPFMGLGFVGLRLAISFFIPLIIGAAAKILLQK